MRQKFLPLAILASLSINAVQATITKYDNPANTVEFTGTGVINLSENTEKQQAWQNEDYSQGERPAALGKKEKKPASPETIQRLKELLKPEEERLFDNLKKFRRGAVIQNLQKRIQPEEKFLFNNLKKFKKEAVTEQLKNQLKAEEEVLFTNLNKFAAEAVSSSSSASQVAQHKTEQPTTDKKRPLLVKQKGTLHIRKYLPETSQQMLSLSETPEAVFEVSQEAFYSKDITKDKKKFLSWLKNSNLFEVS